MPRDTNFYYSFVVLPPAKREAVIAVWDFFRAVDDAVDETPGGANAGEGAAAVAHWREELERCYSGGQPETPQGRALMPHIQRFGLPRQAFEDVVDGVEMDLTPRRWETFEDLRQYCLRVASAVGLVCVEIFGYRNPSCRQYAVDLGVALQLTNIIRDLGKDLRVGRLYVSQDDLRDFSVTEADLRSGATSGRTRALLDHLARRAHEYFDRAERGLPPEDARSMVAARIMGAIYRTLLRRMERLGFPVFDRTVRLSRPHKARVAAWIWLMTMSGVR